jgi:hypothetical protein
LRFWNGRLRREEQVIRDAIWHELQSRSPHPLPDYCRPMREISDHADDCAEADRPSPSPLPSPSGRGCIVSALAEKPAAGFAKPASENSEPAHRRSLSPRQRARVRGERDSLIYHALPLQQNPNSPQSRAKHHAPSLRGPSG